MSTATFVSRLARNTCSREANRSTALTLYELFCFRYTDSALKSYSKPYASLSACHYREPPNGALGLAALGDDTVDWLKRTALKI